MFDAWQYTDVSVKDYKAEIDAAINAINDKLMQVHTISVTRDHLRVKVDNYTERVFNYYEEVVAYLDGVSKGIDFGLYGQD